MNELKFSVRTATTEDLRSYGTLISPEGVSPAFSGDVFSFWNDLDIGDFEGPVTFGMVETKPGPVEAPMLERHLRTSETLVPLDEDIVLFLAEPSNGEWPDLDTVAAFEIKRGTAVTLKKGTWHYVPMIPGEKSGRTLIVFRQGTPSEDLEVRQLKDEKNVLLKISG